MAIEGTVDWEEDQGMEMERHPVEMDPEERMEALQVEMEQGMEATTHLPPWSPLVP